MFKKNVGPLDRGLRIVLGLGLLTFAALGSDSSRWFGLIGVVPLLTAALGSCPLYTVLGMSSCPRKPNTV
jgi:hypothetical protein